MQQTRILSEYLHIHAFGGKRRGSEQERARRLVETVRGKTQMHEEQRERWETATNAGANSSSLLDYSVSLPIISAAAHYLRPASKPLRLSHLDRLKASACLPYTHTHTHTHTLSLSLFLSSSSTPRPPRPRHRPPGTQRRPPRSPSQGQQGPHEPRRTRPPPYPHRRTSGRTHAWST
jgi:hypothetical protein